MDTQLSYEKFAGCILGGAVGDALGAPIEFMDSAEIFARYGKGGLRDYIEIVDDFGCYTDDTQMLLFTAEGLLCAKYASLTDGLEKEPVSFIYKSYLRWFYTQFLYLPQQLANEKDKLIRGWLIGQKPLYAQRAPGTTCCNALRSGKCGNIDEPINDSKGCGGIMRVAPIGLFYNDNPAKAFKVASEAAAITHGHPSGYLSAGCFAAILAYICQGVPLHEAITQTIEILKTYDQYQETLRAIEKAIKLNQRNTCSVAAIESLGGAWVGEEALAISLLCALHYEHDFASGIIASINHSGDSDSTGSLVGNLLGLINGAKAIPDKWIKNLMHHEIVETVTADLYAARYNPESKNWYARYKLNA